MRRRRGQWIDGFIFSVGAQKRSAFSALAPNPGAWLGTPYRSVPRPSRDSRHRATIYGELHPGAKCRRATRSDRALKAAPRGCSSSRRSSSIATGSRTSSASSGRFEVLGTADESETTIRLALGAAPRRRPARHGDAPTAATRRGRCAGCSRSIADRRARRPGVRGRRRRLRRGRHLGLRAARRLARRAARRRSRWRSTGEAACSARVTAELIRRRRRARRRTTERRGSRRPVPLTRARARGRVADRRRAVQQADRQPALHRGADGQEPRALDPREARRAFARRGRGAGARARRLH